MPPLFPRFGFALPAYRRALTGRLLNLPPPRYAVRVDRAISVPLEDGIELLTDHYAPQPHGDALDESFPTILIRTPYGRLDETRFGTGFTLAELPAQRFAERGYHVVVQGVRGCFGSGGEFVPHVHEAGDGAATVAWLARQPWFDGRLATWGPSYLGYCQWATAAHAADALSAMMPMITSAENFSVSHPDGAFGLETRLRWTQGMVALKRMYRQNWRGRLGQATARAARQLQRAYNHLPLLDADEVATGEPVSFHRNLLTHDDPNSPYWQARDRRSAVDQVAAQKVPVHFVGGWYDYYLPGLLRDYQTLCDAGRRPYLTVGPWAHAQPGPLLAGLREGLRWFDYHLHGQGEVCQKPVRLLVMGANEWREFDEFPPPSTERRYFLHEHARLLDNAPTANAPASSYTYDPADPTPSVGGALLAFTGAGAQDNRALEARPDVLTFTTPPLTEPVEIIGEVRVTLFAQSTLTYTDFFARVCDVSPGGRSVNVCDGLVRIAAGSVGGFAEEHAVERGEDGVLCIKINLHATAHRFRSGHAIRLQISSGAHPRWSRNLGTGEPLAAGTAMRVAEQSIFHDPKRRSRVVLPVVE